MPFRSYLLCAEFGEGIITVDPWCDLIPQCSLILSLVCTVQRLHFCVDLVYLVRLDLQLVTFERLCFFADLVHFVDELCRSCLSSVTLKF